MTRYRLVAEPRADLDVVATFDWYEKEQSGLGYEFLSELRATYDRVADGPLQYQHLRSGIRRALVRRFPYAVYFAVEDNYSRGACRAPREPRSSRVAATKGLTTACSRRATSRPQLIGISFGRRHPARWVENTGNVVFLRPGEPQCVRDRRVIDTESPVEFPLVPCKISEES